MKRHLTIDATRAEKPRRPVKFRPTQARIEQLRNFYKEQLGKKYDRHSR